MEEKREIPFTSRMSRFEYAAAIGFIPLHAYLLPRLLVLLFGEKLPDMLALNLVCSVTAALVMTACLWRFLRREFDAMCAFGPGLLREIMKSYGLVLLGNLGAVLLLRLLGHGENPNNAEVFSLARQDPGKTAAMAVFLAPIAEEAMFRGGVFGLLRRYSRPAAYAASMLLFSLAHVWGYALSDPSAWLYVLQYLPSSFLLARIYEKTDSLWASIFLHMTVNGVSLLAAAAAGAFA